MQENARRPRGVLRKLRLFYEALRLEQTLFILPFAYLSMFLAARGLPTWQQFLWVTVAMTGARTLGMASNRLIHRKEDAANPRTAGRHLPRGLLKPWEMGLVMLVSAGVFFFAASQLNTLALILSPVAAFAAVFYSYAKYFTWAAQFCLGATHAIATAGAWIGVTGRLEPEMVLLAFAVAMWSSGFDTLYACQDYEFDRKYGVKSIPSRFGIPRAFWWARSMHCLTAVSLLALGIWMRLGFPYYIGWAIATGLLVYEHRLVKPHDLSKYNFAFTRVNSCISITLLLFTLVSLFAFA